MLSFLFARQQPRRAGGLRPRLEILEDRLAPAVYTVNSPMDLSIAAGVNNTTGVINGTNGMVTLRSAVQASNNNPTTGGNTIDLPSGTYTLSIAPADSDGNDTGDLNILSGSVTIQGAGPANTILDGGGLDRVLNLAAGLGAPLSLTLEDLTIQNGNAPVNANATALGGGILVNAGATLTLTDVRVTGNRAGSPNSAIPPAIGEGGGIAALPGSTLTLTNVLMDNNTAFGTGGAAAANGGAVFAQSASAVSVTNSTFADNNATAGGGFFESNDGLTNAVSFLNSTIAQNNGGGILVTREFPTRPTLLPVLKNTLVAGNTSGDDVQGMVESDGHNLIQDPTGASGLISGDITGQDPRLGPLTNNGGLLPTLALMPGSRAIDAGDGAAATAAGLTTDQRGPLFARIVDGNGDGTATIDIGAFEVQTLPAPTPTPINVTTPAPPPRAEITVATVLHTQKRNKRGKPVGKPVLIGFQFSFNTTMNEDTVTNQSNYNLGSWITKRVRRKTTLVLHPLAFTVSYDPSSNSVKLLLRGKQTFPRGGQITLSGTPPSGISDAAGGFLDGNGTGGNIAVYNISSNAGGIFHA